MIKKRVNTGGLRLPSLERPAYKAGIWELGFWEGSHHSLRLTTVPKLCKPYGLCWTPAFALILEFWYVLDRWCLRDQPPVKTSDTESLPSPLVGNIPRVTQFDAGGIKCVLCDSTGRGLLEARTWFPMDVVHALLPFADFAFAAVNHSWEYNYTPNPGSPPSGPGDPDTRAMLSGVNSLILTKTPQGKKKKKKKNSPG